MTICEDGVFVDLSVCFYPMSSDIHAVLLSDVLLLLQKEKDQKLIFANVVREFSQYKRICVQLLILIPKCASFKVWPPSRREGQKMLITSDLLLLVLLSFFRTTRRR